jgi:hypothetical protein
MSLFTQYIGIDYSGEGQPTQRITGLQVYRADHGQIPQLVTSSAKGATRWSRAELAEWLEVVLATPGTIVGIDHAYSFPLAYFQAYRLKTWDAFLHHFCATYDTLHQRVDDYLDTPEAVRMLPGLPTSIDPMRALRISERWSGTAFSAFDFRPRGVAFSTFAGLPWLYRLRQRLGEKKVFWWPYDGWAVPEGCSVVVEAYATVCRARCDMPQAPWSEHQRDAYAITAWMEERDRHNLLARYFDPALTHTERQAAALEGWILGVA